MKNIVFLFPGQGAQYLGMGKSFYDHYPLAKQTFIEADDLLKENLSKVIFEGPEETLTQTRNSQLGIFVVSIALLRTLQSLYPNLKPKVASGLSLGEYSALYAAEKIGFHEALFLVRDRGYYMNEACMENPGAMAAVLGMDTEKVDQVVSELNLKKDLWIANYNCPGQVVISGTVSGIEKGTNALKAAGARRVVPLQVFGAFHSGLMKSAEEKLEHSLNNVSFKHSKIDIVMNVPGNFIKEESYIPEFLKKQVSHSVRWQQGIQEIEKTAPDFYLEIGCGKVLSGLNKKIGVISDTISIEHTDDLNLLAKRIEA